MTQEALVQKAILGLRMSAPFFAGLLLFAKVEASSKVETAATDGMNIFYNPEFFASLPLKQIQGVLMHEVLHCGLQHVPRRQLRHAEIWNYAADIVVNGMIAGLDGFDLPAGAVRHKAWEFFCVEEVYSLLLKHAVKIPAGVSSDLLHPASGLASASAGPVEMDAAAAARMSQHWRQALRSAITLAEASRKSQGSLPAGFERELESASAPQMDWRTALWRFLVRTPCDFSGYDRRHLHRGLYLEDVQGESLRLHLAVDTSASVDDAQLAEFMAEVVGILRAYPHISCDLYYADAALYGPYDVQAWEGLPKPMGGGGTSFVPFFKAATRRLTTEGHDLAIYFTDGFGEFPSKEPEFPVLWVVCPGGVGNEHFEFGDVVRLT